MADVRLLRALGLRPGGALAALSAKLAERILRHRALVSLGADGLNGASVLFPLYTGGLRVAPSWRQASPEVRLSVVCLFAAFRARGVVAPVTPSLLRGEADPRGLQPFPARRDRATLPAALEHWQPGVVLGFGELDGLICSAVGARGLWQPGATALLRPVLQRDPAAVDGAGLAAAGSSDDEAALAGDVAVEPGATAVELPGGVRLSFGELLAAVEDVAPPPPLSTPEGALIALLRAARADGAPANRARRSAAFSFVGSRQPWWCPDEGALLRWPPVRLPARPASPWKAVEDEVSGAGTYYWNVETDETSWEVPGTGRRSAIRLGLPTREGRFGRSEMRDAGGEGARRGLRGEAARRALLGAPGRPARGKVRIGLRASAIFRRAWQAYCFGQGGGITDVSKQSEAFSQRFVQRWEEHGAAGFRFRAPAQTVAYGQSPMTSPPGARGRRSARPAASLVQAAGRSAPLVLSFLPAFAPPPPAAAAVAAAPAPHRASA